MHIFWRNVTHDLNHIQWQIARQLVADLEHSLATCPDHPEPAASTTMLLQAQQHLHDAQSLLTRARREYA